MGMWAWAMQNPTLFTIIVYTPSTLISCGVFLWAESTLYRAYAAEKLLSGDYNRD